MQAGLVFNIQKYSIQDGPGIRTTVFMKGCPLRCPWCHNPESQSMAREIVIVSSRCIQCGECVPVCAVRGPGSPMPGIRPDDCLTCGKCVEKCPTSTRQVVGQRMTVDEVMADVERDRMFYEQSGGGVTFSGGEPLAQPVFLHALLKACREKGIHTVVDTCGYGQPEYLEAVASLTHLVLYDLKIMDDRKHRLHCGVSNEVILRNLKHLDEIHNNIWLRVPVVPGFNDDEENFSQIANFARELRHVTQINLLPFHATARDKYVRFGLTHKLDGVQTPSLPQMDRAAHLLSAVGPSVKIGG